MSPKNSPVRTVETKTIIAISVFILGAIGMISLFVMGTLPKLQYASFPVSDIVEGVNFPDEVFEVPTAINEFVQDTQTSIEVETTMNELDFLRQQDKEIHTSE